jgi:NosR/NirI family transcriptional regulator, nitrous oxide reductase regulator
MDKGNKIFIVIIIIALFSVIFVANTQKITNQILPASTQNTESNSTTEKTAPDQAGSGQIAPQVKYIDGMYEGQGTGKNPGIKVSVTIKDDKITDITVISCNDNSEYFDEAAAVIPKSIIEAQATNVDTVSGSTLSSEGIIKAVEDALSKASK